MDILSLGQAERYGRVIGCGGPSGRIFGNSGSTLVTVASLVIPAGRLAPCSRLEVDVLVDFFAPNNAGRSVVVNIGGETVGQAYPTGSQLRLNAKMTGWVSPNQKALLLPSQNLTDNTAGSGATYGVGSSSNTTSLTIDFTAEQTLTIQVGPVNDDVAELVGWCVANTYAARTPINYAPLALKQTALWGDSLTAGSGATVSGLRSSGTGYPARLMVTSVGRAVFDGGVGGETAQQILTRILADKDRARNWTGVYWMGRNNVGSGTMQADVLASLASALSVRNNQRIGIMGVLNASTEGTGNANLTAIKALNTAIAAAYPDYYIDIRSALCTESDETVPAGSRADTIHLNDTGYATVTSTVKTYLDGKGW